MRGLSAAAAQPGDGKAAREPRESAPQVQSRAGHRWIIADARHLLAILLVALAAALASASPAHADADPPSDVLLLQDVYYPYQDDVSAPRQAQLDALTAQAKKAGFGIKLAILATPADLGAIPEFFGHVQRYASFLEKEIRYNRPRPLLVAMPSGFATVSTGPKGPAIVASLPRVHDASAEQLARVAVGAIVRLAAANGHRLRVPPLRRSVPAREGGSTAIAPHASRKRGHPSLALYFVPPLALAGAAFALSTLQRRRRRAASRDAAP